MVHYTLLPPELIFFEQNEHDLQLREIEINGIKMIVEIVDFNLARIVRIISSDPQHFLNDDYKPGNYISFEIGCV